MALLGVGGFTMLHHIAHLLTEDQKEKIYQQEFGKFEEKLKNVYPIK